MTKLIGLDISAASTGVAIGDGTGPPRTFAVSFTGMRPEMSWRYLTWLRDLLVVEKPDGVAFEKAFVPDQRRGSVTNIETIQLLLSLNFHTESLCYGRGIDAWAVYTGTWRKAFLGNGKIEDPKQTSLDLCQRLGWETHGVHDRAEACGVWAWGHYYHGNQRAMRELMSNTRAQPLAGSG